jgi:hypothetical protein
MILLSFKLSCGYDTVKIWIYFSYGTVKIWISCWLQCSDNMNCLSLMQCFFVVLVRVSAKVLKSFFLPQEFFCHIFLGHHIVLNVHTLPEDKNGENP